ncbi:MAG: hypothetical protein E6Q06_04915 [Candidatus Moraniibacteriota bacterium]|nr:MAG: hypothetical protein E6Q06_04915 [Candidatus Moranbacteria bacterium]
MPMAEIQLPFHPFRPRWPKIALAAVLFVVLIIIATLGVVYRGSDSALGRFLASRFPFPIVFIGQGVAVTTEGLAENLAALRHFYESQDFAELGMRVDFTTEDGKRRLKIRERDLINKMLEDKAVELLAHERGISITGDQVAAETTVKMQEFGTTEKVEETLARVYGWTIADFQEQIVRPAMYEAELFRSYERDVDQAKAKEAIQAAEKALRSKEPFSEVARKYSEGETRAEGGDLGWFRLEDLAPELRGPVDNAKISVPTAVVESPLGYHILLVEETKIDGDVRQYHIHQIFTRKLSFADWLVEAMRGLPVSVISDEYEWDRAEARIEFRSEELRAFEKQLRENAESDPTLIF